MPLIMFQRTRLAGNCPQKDCGNDGHYGNYQDCRSDTGIRMSLHFQNHRRELQLESYFTEEELKFRNIF